MKKIGFLLLISSWAWAQQNVSQKITVSDLTKVTQVTDVLVSPAKNQAFYLLKSIEARPDAAFEYDYRSHLFTVDLLSPTPTPKALTRGASSVSQVSVTPDGKSVIFVRAQGEKAQVFQMPLDGGEAFPITKSKYGASSPVLSPDGKKIIFSVSISMKDLLSDSLLNPGLGVPAWSFEKPGFASNDFLRTNKAVKPNPDGTLEEIRAFLAKDVEDKKAKVINRLNFHGEADVEPELRFSHLFIADVKENAVAKPLTSGFWSVGQAVWSADGTKIYAVTGKDKDQHPDREQESVILEINPLTGAQRILIEEAGKSFYGVTPSPDGKALAMIMNTPNLLSFGQLVIAKTDGSDRKVINFDRVPSNMEWSADSQILYFTAQSNGGVPLFKWTAKTGKIDRITDFESGITSFALAGTQVVFAKTEVKNPSELFISDLTVKQARQLTTHNAVWLAGKSLSYPEKRTYKNSLGQEVEYWIMPPAQRESGKKYPLLLQLHGGPTAMWGPGEFSMWHEFQFFCAQGYGVVYPNPRGSGGYGKEFQFANYRDWGTGPQEDVLAAASAAAKESWADTARQVITGGSYAGYLTAWIVAHDHRFKAAFAQRGVYELATFMGEANAWRLAPNYFGLPWEDEAVTKMKANSPYTFVDKIKTPLLIKHGENDLRTGVSQSEMMFRSLKYLNKEVEYVRMPGGTHELSRSGNVRQRMDRILRIYEFFERYVGIN
ncbi:MAG: prolyl oligopeptidase family serine peptidase [Spirosomataceae bacterium]